MQHLWAQPFSAFSTHPRYPRHELSSNFLHSFITPFTSSIFPNWSICPPGSFPHHVAKAKHLCFIHKHMRTMSARNRLSIQARSLLVVPVQVHRQVIVLKKSNRLYPPFIRRPTRRYQSFLYNPTRRISVRTTIQAARSISINSLFYALGLSQLSHVFRRLSRLRHSRSRNKKHIVLSARLWRTTKHCGFLFPLWIVRGGLKLDFVLFSTNRKNSVIQDRSDLSYSYPTLSALGVPILNGVAIIFIFLKLFPYQRHQMLPVIQCHLHPSFLSFPSYYGTWILFKYKFLIGPLPATPSETFWSITAGKLGTIKTLNPSYKWFGLFSNFSPHCLNLGGTPVDFVPLLM